MRIRFSFIHENRFITVTFITTLNSFIILGKKKTKKPNDALAKSYFTLITYVEIVCN